MSNLELYDKIRSVPQAAQKTIGAGRLKGMTDINPQWRIKTLTEQFGVCGFGWYTEIVREWLETGANGEITANVEIKLYIKQNDEWSKGITGIGGSKLVAKENNGLYTSDECFKMAFTDAISVACKQLGMGADIYFAKDRTKYSDAQDTKPQAKPTKTQAPTNNSAQPQTSAKTNLKCDICGSAMESKLYDQTKKAYGMAICSKECKIKAVLSGKIKEDK